MSTQAPSSFLLSAFRAFARRVGPLRRSVVAVICLVPASADAQFRQDGSAALTPPASSLPATPTGFYGYTFCRNGLAESWVRADKIGTTELEELLAHEAVHREQAARFPVCEDWLKSVTSAKRIIEAEIPAYCAQLKVAVAQGGNREALTRDYAFRIAAQSGAMENRMDIRQMFARDCTEATPILGDG